MQEHIKTNIVQVSGKIINSEIAIYIVSAAILINAQIDLKWNS